MLTSILIVFGACLCAAGLLCVALFLLRLCQAAAHGDRMIGHGQGDHRDG